MAVWIKKINVEKVGPISGLQLDLNRFNLIYGRNEQGKTFLVEFIIQTLFKNLSGWSVRASSGAGNIELSGLGGDSTVTLRPSSKRKIEDYLMDKQPGLPPRISKLLVVKGADLNFDDEVKSGVRQDDLKVFLAGQGVLDVIEKKISKTVRKAVVEEDRITGDSRGEISNRKILASDKEQIDGLFDQIEVHYSGGERQALHSRIDELTGSIGDQETAKRHLAYELSQRIQEQQGQLDRLPEEDLERLKADFNEYQGSENRIGRQEEKLDRLSQESQGFEWLEEAISLYEKRGTQERKKVSPLLPVAIVLSLVLSVASSFAGYPLGTVLLVVFAMLLGWLYVRQYRSALEEAADSEEIEKLEIEFEKRFGKALSGLPELKETKKSMEGAYFGLNTVVDELKEEQGEIEDLEDRIRASFMNLADKSPERDGWGSELRALSDRRAQSESQLTSTKMSLAARDVPESEFQVAPAFVEYDKERLGLLESERDELVEKLRVKTDELNNLKGQISTLTKDDISADWETLILKLQAKRVETATAYREVTAKILAGILVNEQLDIIRTQEEAEIKKGVESAAVVEPVHRITGVYSSLNYDDGNILVNDEYKQFALSDLSTGALEQVLLGLRLGFAARLLHEERLFLILDDAFQHADWDRRELLIAKMVDLAIDGWQIIYFTMDDHIKELFDEAGNRYFKDQYLSHNLDPNIQAV